LSHPNIWTIFDVGQEGETAYIAMELLEGRSLHQMLKDPQRIPFHTAADIIAQVAEALEHAHKFSIVHRDVKPANVVVAPSGRAKLTDFGVAYIPASNVTQTGSALGSPRYMAPEQVLGQPIDSRADLFSLGVVLYELLTKRTPFEWPGDTTVFALMQRIAGEPHPPLRQIDPQIPEGFDRIMDRALAKRPQERYQKAAEMAGDLRNYQSLGRGTVFAKTVPLPVLPTPAAAAKEQKVRSQLIDDLDQFAKKRGMAALDSAMRAAHQYLTEFGKEMNAHEPHAGKPYEFIYLGRLASVTLTQATVNSRMFKLAADKELCAQIRFHYRVRAAEPPKVMLLGEDVGRCEQYLKSLRVAFQVRANTEGKERPTVFVVSGPLPCEVNIRADYEAATASVELINVRRFGRVT